MPRVKSKDSPPSKSKRAPSAEQLNALKPTSDEDIKKIILFMSDKEISLRSACKQLKFSYNVIVERVIASPELRALDSEARCNYMRQKVRTMNEIASKEPDVQRARLMCDNIKWEAARIMRVEFGDHVIVAGDAANPLVMKLVSNAAELTSRIRRGETIEHDAPSAPQ